jgi:hypothetical protein
MALFFAWFVIGATAIAAQQQSDPETVVRAMFGAFNNGNIDEFASYVSDDATATGFCRPAGSCHNKAEIAAATSAEISEGVHAEIRTLSVSGNTVTVQISEAGPGLAELGVERVYINVTFTVVDGKVTQFDDHFDLNDPQTATFVQRLEGAESERPSAVPATGDGPARESDPFGALFLIALLASGATMVLLGAAHRHRRVQL